VLTRMETHHNEPTGGRKDHAIWGHKLSWRGCLRMSGYSRIAREEPAFQAAGGANRTHRHERSDHLRVPQTSWRPHKRNHPVLITSLDLRSTLTIDVGGNALCAAHSDVFIMDPWGGSQFCRRLRRDQQCWTIKIAMDLRHEIAPISADNGLDTAFDFLLPHGAIVACGVPGIPKTEKVVQIWSGSLPNFRIQ
jgi:hypothetical protein